MADQPSRVCFRIYTEDIDPCDPRLSSRASIPATIVHNWFGGDGFTCYKAKGVWNEQSEPSLVFEIIRPSDPGSRRSVQSAVNAVARLIADYCGQESVMITEHEVLVSFVEPNEHVKKARESSRKE